MVILAYCYLCYVVKEGLIETHSVHVPGGGVSPPDPAHPEPFALVDWLRNASLHEYVIHSPQFDKQSIEQ